MLSIDEINLLKSQNERLKKQNKELQKENRILKHKLSSEKRKNTKLLNMLNERKKDEILSND